VKTHYVAFHHVNYNLEGVESHRERYKGILSLPILSPSALFHLYEKHLELIHTVNLLFRHCSKVSLYIRISPLTPMNFTMYPPPSSHENSGISNLSLQRDSTQGCDPREIKYLPYDMRQSPTLTTPSALKRKLSVYEANDPEIQSLPPLSDPLDNTDRLGPMRCQIRPDLPLRLEVPPTPRQPILREASCSPLG
jgi:hypothetical protein